MLDASFKLQALATLHQARELLLMELRRLPVILDTISLQRRKTNIEERLEEVEHGMRLYEKERVVVHDGWEEEAGVRWTQEKIPTDTSTAFSPFQPNESVTQAPSEWVHTTEEEVVAPVFVPQPPIAATTTITTAPESNFRRSESYSTVIDQSEIQRIQASASSDALVLPPLPAPHTPPVEADPLRAQRHRMYSAAEEPLRSLSPTGRVAWQPPTRMMLPPRPSPPSQPSYEDLSQSMQHMLLGVPVQ